MVFDIKNKVALITGGASGFGLLLSKELLQNGAKGVTIADVNIENGKQAIEEIEKAFGLNRAIFVKADVTNYKEFEAAFEETIRQFNNVDILINNAGIGRETAWEKEISVNINGTVHGMLLGMEKYLSKYKQAEEALIVNMSSIAATLGHGAVPVYCATKHAILSMVKSWGNQEFYDETKIRVIGVCPGPAATEFLSDMSDNIRDGIYKRYWEKYPNGVPQDPKIVAKEAMKVIQWAPNGTNWIIENGGPAYQYAPPNRSTMKHNVLPCQ